MKKVSLFSTALAVIAGLSIAESTANAVIIILMTLMKLVHSFIQMLMGKITLMMLIVLAYSKIATAAMGSVKEPLIVLPSSKLIMMEP